MSRTSFASYLPQINYAVAENGAAAGAETTENKSAQEADSGNNKEDIVDQFDKMWETDIEKEKPKGDLPANQQQAPQAKTEQEEAEFISGYIKKLELTKGIDANKIVSDLNDGNTESLLGAMEASAGKAFTSALNDMNRIMDQKMKDFEEKVVKRASNKMDGNMAVRSMNEALPFTTKPAFAPVAQVVLQQLINKHGDTGKAVTEVGDFFKSMSSLSAKDLKLNIAPSSQPGRGSFGGDAPPNSGGKSEETTKWVDILSSKG